MRIEQKGGQDDALRRMWIFAAIVGVALVVLLYFSTLWFRSGTSYGNMGQMMGYYEGMSYYMIAPTIAVVALLIVGVAGIAYYAAYPDPKIAAGIQTRSSCRSLEPSCWELVDAPPNFKGG